MGRTGAINAKLHVLVHLGPFFCALNSMQMGQSGAINAKVRVTKSRLNMSPQTRPIHTIGPQTHVCVSYCLRALGTVSLLH